jgi:hypothetical protein
MLERTYGAVHIVNLLSQSKPGEVELTERYRYHVGKSPLRRHEEGEMEEHHLLRETEFDFHEQTRAAGYGSARSIRPYVETSLESFVYFLCEEIMDESVVQTTEIKRPVVVMQQNGVFRVNCLDCLDRTNLVQSMLSKMALELFLSHRAEKGNSDFWMRHDVLWADNGDVLSKIYAGTGALKSSFTRHGKMSFAGAIADARKSATRLYVNHFEDKSRQNTVDLLLGRLVGQNSVDLFDPINDWVTAEVGRRRSEVETRDHIQIWVGTYNLNGKTTGVKEDLSPWLNVRNRNLDIVVVGFQEIVELSPQQIMSTDPNRRMLWETAVRQCLNGNRHDEKTAIPGKRDEYVLLRSGQLVGAALLVFVRSSILGRIKNVEGAIKKTGMSGIAGNKGAVAIRMDVESTSVCFVTAHLAAGFGNYEERNRDYNTITSGLRFQRNRSIEDHEVVVWAGDFNYRIGLGYERTKELVSAAMTTEKTREDSLGLLYLNDQLNIQMVAGNCFNFYREGRVRFLPTYKYDLGKDEFDSSDKQRIPAWTDRIVWKVNHNYNNSASEDLGSKMKQLEYDSVMSLRFSDHRPVYATFEMGIRVIDEEKKEALIKRLYAKRAREVMSKSSESIEGFEDLGSSEEDDSESVTGYKSIQEGLPAASSDRRKWWLDGDQAARSSVRPPKDGVMLNSAREANPWKESEEDDWVEVDSIPASMAAGNGEKGLRQTASLRPLPPPSRTTRRMVPPAWEGDRPTVQSESTKSSGSTPASRVSSVSSSTPRILADSSPPPVSSPRRKPPPTVPIRSSSSASMMKSTAFSKQPPPKPSKPTSLAVATSSQPANNSQTNNPPRSTSKSHTEPDQQQPSRRITNTDGANDDPPPPLPRRTGTASSTASFVSASHSTSDMHMPSRHNSTKYQHPPPPPPPPPSRMRNTSHRHTTTTTTSPHVHREMDVDMPGPPLPPRTNTNTNDNSLDNGLDGNANAGLMDNDGSNRNGLDRYKPLMPQ